MDFAHIGVKFLCSITLREASAYLLLESDFDLLVCMLYTFIFYFVLLCTNIGSVV